jgi:hypothetical protein
MVLGMVRRTFALVLGCVSLVGCAGVEPIAVEARSVDVSKIALCPSGLTRRNGRCEVTPLIEPSDIDTSCPRGMYNDMSQRCVPDVVESSPSAPLEVAHATPSPPKAVPAPPPRELGAMVHIAAFEKVTAFDLDVTEVTVKAYAACVSDGSCVAAATHDDPDLFGRRLHGSCNKGDDKPDHPVNCVNLSQARAYCTWAGKRLPRPSEWLLAAGGPEGRPYPWGTKRPGAGDLCVGDVGSCTAGAHAIDTTPEGAKDMGGNVTEWTDDEYPGFSGGGIAMVFVLGGNWLDNDPRVWDVPARSNTSFVVNADEHSALVGFRCAR